MNLGSVDLNLLVALQALLAERNVTRAGQRIRLGQPAMSAALARLRKMFADPLLVRRGNELELTPLAESLVDQVNEILALVEHALTDRPSFDPATDTRTFSVLASDYVVWVVIRPLIEHLLDVAPHVRVTVQPMVFGFGDRLDRDEVDLAICPREVPVRLPDFPSQDLFRDRYVCIAWRDNAEIGAELTLDQLSTLPYLSYRSGDLKSIADCQLEALGITTRLDVTTESLVTLPFLVRGTRLIAMVHERLARDVVDAAAIRLLEPPVPLTPITEAAFWHPRRTADPAHQWLRAQIAALALTL